MKQSTTAGCSRGARTKEISGQNIVDIFVGAHLATAVEAMGFTEAIGLDTAIMYDIISKAAGSNTQFVNHVPKMRAPTWTLRDVPEAYTVRQKLVCGACLLLPKKFAIMILRKQ